MPDIEDFLPAEPPAPPLPKGFVRMMGIVTSKEEIGIGYYAALASEVFKKYLRCELTREQFLKEVEDIEKMYLEERER